MLVRHLFCFTIWSCGGEGVGGLFVCLWGSVYFCFGVYFYVSKTRLRRCLLYQPAHAKKKKMLLVVGLKLDVINLPLLKRQIPKPQFVRICWGLLLVMSAASECHPQKPSSNSVRYKHAGPKVNMVNLHSNCSVPVLSHLPRSGKQTFLCNICI